MKVTCYGPRGSLPSPSRKGFSTMEYGGNTTCYFVQAGDIEIVLDFGSGVSVLGDVLVRQKPRPRIALISHYHWDHIQGLPFAAQFFIPGNTFHIHGPEPVGQEGHAEDLRTTTERLLSEQQASPHFPVAHASLPAERRYHSHPRLFTQSFWYYLAEDGSLQYVPDKVVGVTKETLPADVRNDLRRWVKIQTVPVNHPDGCLGYRIDWMQYSFLFCTDHEPARYTWGSINKIGKGATVGVLDGQYREDQIAGMCQGFGHGTPRSCVEQARDAGLLYCLIHHHDPKHSDEVLAEMERDAQQYAVSIGYTGKVRFAREGETINFEDLL